MMLKNEITVPVSEWNVSGGRIPLGYVGESNVEKVIFDFSEDLPAAVYRIEIKDRSRSRWHLLSIEGRMAVFNVPADILLFSGAVDLQMVAVAEGATVKKSNVFSGYVYGSVQAGEEVPPEEIGAFEQALADYDAKLQQAIDAAEFASQSAESAEQSVGIAQTSAEDAIRARDAAVQAKTDAVSAAESAEQAKAGTARDAVIASDFANKAEYAKTDAQESARRAQQSAAESARHASDSASSADLAGRSVEAIRSMSADAETLEAGSEAIASYDINSNKLHFGIPKGPKGDRGDVGEKGADGVNGINGKDGRDGRDGVDGRTPVKGTDYFTPADVEEIVQETIERVPTYDDTEIKTDIENLESKKVGYSEVSGSQLLMYTDSTKSVLVAALDLPAAPVRNVTVDGSSIVDGNGNAIIPLANGSSIGLFRPSNGATVINGWLTAQTITALKYPDLQTYYFISKGTLENVKGDLVRRAMSAPISATDPEWSDAEKLAARERMGVNTEYERIHFQTYDSPNEYIRPEIAFEAKSDVLIYISLSAGCLCNNFGVMLFTTEDGRTMDVGELGTISTALTSVNYGFLDYKYLCHPMFTRWSLTGAYPSLNLKNGTLGHIFDNTRETEINVYKKIKKIKLPSIKGTFKVVIYAR